MIEPTSLPYSTAAIPGCGGRIKVEPGDFIVAERPAYTPCGTGEHVYLLIEKTGYSTPALLQRLSEVTGCKRRDMGCAGRKDTRARTRQWVSLHMLKEPRLDGLETEGIRILAVSRHTNKLRPGHSRGNEFDILIRDVRPHPNLSGFMERLRRCGFPNYFGPQRLGTDGDNAARGKAWLFDDGPSTHTLDRVRFHTNAYQSALFNDIAAQRLRAGHPLDGILAGDLVIKHDSGGCFPVSAEALEEPQRRADLGLVSATAPLFGYKVTLAQGEPGAWERQTLAREQLTLEHFRKGGKRLSAKGERRSIRAIPEALTWELLSNEGSDAFEGTNALEGAYALRLRFSLAPGQYATALLREVIKDGGGWP